MNSLSVPHPWLTVHCVQLQNIYLWRNSLCICSNPVNNSVLIKIMLMSEHKCLAFTEFSYKNKWSPIKVVPLLCYLHMNEKKSNIIDSEHSHSLWTLCVVCCSPFSGDTVLEIQQLPVAPSWAFYQFYLLKMSPLRNVPNETSSAVLISERAAQH